MAELQAYPIVTGAGTPGRIFRESRFLDRSESFRVVLDSGEEIQAPSAAIQVRPDGTFVLDEAAVPARNGAAAAPAPEVPRPNREQTERRAMPVERPEPPPEPEAAPRHPASVNSVSLDEPLFAEEVVVERVPVNRIVDGPVQTRQEGDTTVIPVIEEVLTVHKRILLREEVRITRKRTEIREPRPIVMSAGESRVVGADGRPIDLPSKE